MTAFVGAGFSLSPSSHRTRRMGTRLFVADGGDGFDAGGSNSGNDGCGAGYGSESEHGKYHDPGIARGRSVEKTGQRS